MKKEIRLKFDEATHKRIQEIAMEYDLPISNWIKFIIMKEIKRLESNVKLQK
jgi:hypothetical protein